jgi:hypothetical protein
MSAIEKLTATAASYAATEGGRERLPLIVRHVEVLRMELARLGLAFIEGDALWLGIERASIELADIEDALHEAARA